MTDTALSILVIDDEAGIRESIGAYLEDSGYLILEAPILGRRLCAHRSQR